MDTVPDFDASEPGSILAGDDFFLSFHLFFCDLTFIQLCSGFSVFEVYIRLVWSCILDKIRIKLSLWLKNYVG